MLLDELDLRDVTLVGHSMGTGELTRHRGNYGSGCVARAVLVSPIPPFLLRPMTTRKALPGSLFLGFVESANADIPAWMKGFLDNFYEMDQYAGKLVSPEAFASSLAALAVSAIAAVACIPT
jgi:non-heme chloroperoxidase